MAVVPQDSVRSHSSSTPAGTRPPARRTLWLSHRSRPTSCQPPAPCCALSERAPLWQERTMFKVLVFAMLSSASGWGLPKDDPLSSNDTGGVDGARDQRQLQNRGADGKGGGYGKGYGGGNGPVSHPIWPLSRFCALSLSSIFPAHRSALGLRRWQTLRSVRTLPRALSLSRSRRLQTS